MSGSFQPHGLKHARLPYPPLSPGVCSNSCPLSWWCYLTTSSSAALFSFCLQSFSASGSFSMSWFFASCGHSIGASASASVLLVSIQGWFPLGLTGLISLLSKGLSRVFLQHHNSKAPNLWRSAFFMVQRSLLYMTTGKTIALTIWTFIGKMMCLLFNMLSRFLTAFKKQASSNPMATVTICSDTGVQEKKMCHCFCFFPFYFPRMGPDAIILVSECWILSQLFHSPLSPSSRGSLVPLRLLSSEWYRLHIWSYWFLPCNLDSSLWLIQPGISYDVLCT